MHHILKSALAAAVAASLAVVPASARVPDAPAIPDAAMAPIAYMVDANSGQVLFAREQDRRFMPASMTKVMTTFLAFEWMQEGKLHPQQVIAVRPETWTKWHNVGSTMFLPLGARLTADTLIHGVTTVSANDGAVVLAEGAAGSVPAWIEAMNAKAREIGMQNSHFGTPNGWMDDGRTFVTARDLVTLGREMIRRHPDNYKHYVGRHNFNYNGIAQVNHDPISGIVPGADGIKTGFTNQAGYGFIGSAERNGRRLIMVVAASPRGLDRNKAAREFLEWGFAAYQSRTLFPAGAHVATAEVQDGSVSDLELKAEGPITASYLTGTTPRITSRVRYEGPLQAPIRKGERVGEMIVDVEGMPEYRVPLVAGSDVFKATAVQRVFNGLAGWLP